MEIEQCDINYVHDYNKIPMIISLLDRACPASVDIFRRPVPYTAAVSYTRGRVARVAWPVTASPAALRSVQLLALRFLPCYDL